MPIRSHWSTQGNAFTIGRKTWSILTNRCVSHFIYSTHRPSSSSTTLGYQLAIRQAKATSRFQLNANTENCF